MCHNQDQTGNFRLFEYRLQISSMVCGDSPDRIDCPIIHQSMYYYGGERVAQHSFVIVSGMK